MSSYVLPITLVAALVGQAVYGPRTEIHVDHSGLDTEGNAESVSHFELRIYDGLQQVGTLRMEVDADTGNSDWTAFGLVAVALRGKYRLETVAVDKAGNVSDPTALAAQEFDGVPPSKPIRVRLKGIDGVVVTLEPVP